jgi:Carboxypeptidase regulatory-like domain/TonB dependent receptor-like, beta-barrel/TonB-dependent Receptor Plug Domain
VFGCAAAALAAQEGTGKIEGSVTDQSGAPIASAQVTLVGTAFGALTSERGYYFMNNVPSGIYTVRAKFIGYTASEVTGVRILGGQTITTNIKLTPSAVAIGPVIVEAAANPIVPRDQVSSKSIITNVGDLPADDIRQVIALSPGVVESGANMGLSLRGGRPGDANVYVDGAPVRSNGYGQQIIQLGTNAVEEASVTTGALGVDFGNAQSGLIAYTTRSGGQKYAGSYSYDTDEPFGNSISNGLNRMEASLGGPVPAISKLNFFVSGVLQGQTSCGVAPPSRGLQASVGCFGSGFGQDNVPTYVLGGLDTTVTVNKADGSGVQSVAIPQFVQYGGQCSSADNFGFACQGQRFPLNWNTAYQGQAKLAYSYGGGSNLSLTGLTAQQERRNYPGFLLVNSSAQNSAGNNIGDPALYTGDAVWSRLAVLNWNHSVFKAAEHQLSLNVNLSYAQDNRIRGRLDPAYEVSTRSPAGGFSFNSMKFTGFGDMPWPIDDSIIKNVRLNQGLRIPYIGRSDLLATQAYRMNPYGLSASEGWYTSGIDDGRVMTTYHENRLRAFGRVDWQANRYQRFNFGGEYNKSNLSFWSGALSDEIFLVAYAGKPYTAALWAADRLDLGDVVIDLGVRYDRMNAEALFPNSPGRISTNPAWSRSAATNADSLAASIARVYTPAATHTALSPRLGVSFPITEHTNFRLSYAHQVNTPDFNTLLSGTNNDLSFTNTNDFFGSDIGFGKTILVEFGVRHAFSSDLVLDVSAYNKDFVANPAYRIEQLPDPANPGATQDINVLTSSDFGYARGIDVSVIRRIGTWFNASLAYTLQFAKNTGSDPFSYLNTSGRQFYSALNEQVPPPEQALPTNDERAHNVVASVAISVPGNWKKGSVMGSVLRDMGVFITARAVSGLPYTRLINTGQGQLAPFERFGLTGQAVEPINSSTMPWTKYLDLRLNKGVKLGKLDWTLFADVRNLFNFKNVVALFAETGDVVNVANRNKQLDSEKSTLATEAGNNGAFRSSDRAVILNGTGGAAACSAWTGDAGPVNCVMLQRTEQRFGNGDGIFTVGEQLTALNAWYDSFNGVSRLYGAPRTIRVGAELSF